MNNISILNHFKPSIYQEFVSYTIYTINIFKFSTKPKTVDCLKFIEYEYVRKYIIEHKLNEKIDINIAVQFIQYIIDDSTGFNNQLTIICKFFYMTKEHNLDMFQFEIETYHINKIIELMNLVILT